MKGRAPAQSAARTPAGATCRGLSNELKPLLQLLNHEGVGHTLYIHFVAKTQTDAWLLWIRSRPFKVSAPSLPHWAPQRRGYRWAAFDRSPDCQPHLGLPPPGLVFPGQRDQMAFTAVKVLISTCLLFFHKPQ